MSVAARGADPLDVSVVIVTYRCRGEARECLASLYRVTTGVSFDVVVLDNASNDGTVEMVASEFPAARLLPLDENIGFAAGVNRAAAEASGEFLLLLNPDTVVHEGAVESLVAFARSRPQHGIYGGRTLDPDGTVNPGSCWGRPTLWSLFCFATMLSTAFKRSSVFNPESLGRWPRDSVREVDIVTGCLLLAERRVWDELGGFDTRFFMYGEDADLALRAAHLGYRPIITPDAVITHEIGVSSQNQADKLVLLYQSKAELVRKHFGPMSRPLGLTLLWLGVGARALLSGGSQKSAARAAWREVWRARSQWLAGYADGAPAAVTSTGAS
jgi:N-acetylglucosaminyl-diphospho-decaprenol L-rhamnosyltransferase